MFELISSKLLLSILEQLKFNAPKIANEAIKKTVEFFHTVGMDTKLSDYTKDYDKTASFIVDRFKERGWLGLGEKQNITLEKVKEIVEMSY